jgi:DnaJ-domain-containing protein 1
MSARSPEALEAALAMLRRPQLARLAHRSSLPRGVTLLLEVAADEPDALREATALTGMPGPLLSKAASFFMEQVLLTRKSDSYRVLGASNGTSPAELRRHMALILKWLHPDRVQGSSEPQHFDRSALAALVTGAWENLKNGDRRAAYDAVRHTEAAESRKGVGAGALTAKPRRLAVYKIERDPLWTRLLVYLGRLR